MVWFLLCMNAEMNFFFFSDRLIFLLRFSFLKFKRKSRHFLLIFARKLDVKDEMAEIESDFSHKSYSGFDIKLNFFIFELILLYINVDGWGTFHLGYSGNTDPEPGRCRRTDGKKWRCSRDAVTDQKYCERHINRGRHRSRKPVEGQTGHSNSKVVPTTSSVSTSVIANGGVPNSLAISQHELKNLQPVAANPSADALVSRWKITVLNLNSLYLFSSHYRVMHFEDDPAFKTVCIVYSFSFSCF